ncbi:MAG: C_GCAxxG_C_C family protein [Ruminococcaceae bacterium]|nr:C_GCAxxG_C_C family protein [Oscillospiraceae bacterium]
MKKRSEIAAELFVEGYNCAQAVVGAFADLTNIDFETLMKLSSSFGGGMGGMREGCGAVSGMAIVLGILEGYSAPDDYEGKKEHYANVKALADKFKEKHETIICRELLAGIKKATDNVPEKRTEEYYKTRPCVRFVITAAEILEEAIAKCTDHTKHKKHIKNIF